MSTSNAEMPGTSDESPPDKVLKPDILPGYASIEDFTKDGYKTLMEAIKHSNALPAGRDFNFYNTSPSFTNILGEEGGHVLRLINQIIRCNEIKSNIKNRILDEKTELVVEANDMILEKVANNIDEMNGIRKTVLEPVVLQTVSAQLPINGSWNRISNATFSINSAAEQSQNSRDLNCIKLITAKNIVRPQKFFKDKIENSYKYPWQPRITDKPNSLKPLAIFLEEYEDRQEFSHPYEYELDRFVPTPEQMLLEPPVEPKPLSETPLIEIDKPEQLDELVETLRYCKEIAVDLEHHSYRSFMGFTCLMQISTGDKDYIIDTLALRDKLCVLNEVFTKNNIVKIFHGADKDIEWLQRDLSLYVVNMFDTHQAAKVLEYSVLSLAYLMKRFCNILPNKQFQLADWRIRPLPDELKKYAREDTHYLLYIYRMLKKELLAKANGSDNLLKSVIERSTEVCRKRYFKPILTDESHLDMYRRCKKMFDNRQLYALKEIYAWRDHVAREEDESLGYILPNHMLLQISEILPREMQGILACCNPIPPFVRSNLLELHKIVLRAREQPLERAVLKESTYGRGVLKTAAKVNVDSPLHCPHDLTKGVEFRDDLPTLLSNDELQKENRNFKVSLSIEKESLTFSIFDSEVDNKLVDGEAVKKVLSFSRLSPYERYKLVKPFVQAEEDRSAAEKAEEEKRQEEERIAAENRTDAERVASVRDHFLQMSKKFSEELALKKQQEEKEKSLVQMGGTRKRKREFSENQEEYCSDQQVAENQCYTPRPRIRNDPYQFNSNRKRGKKRNFNEMEANEQQQQQYFEGQQSKKKKKNKNNQPIQPQNKKKGGKKKQPQNSQSWQQQNPQQWQQVNPWEQQSHYDDGGWKKPFPPKQGNSSKQSPSKRGKKQKKNDSTFVPYDYSAVDFREFRGGAGSANQGLELNPNFRPKGRKKAGRGAKSATFGRGGPRGRGRGGGRGRQTLP